MWKKQFRRFLRMISGNSGSDADELPRLEDHFPRLERFIHFWVLVLRSFVRNRCPMRASALSYTTLLALIPTLAVAMSVTSIFLKSKGEAQIERFIQEFVNRMIPQPLVTTNAAFTASSEEEQEWLFLSGATNIPPLMEPGATNAPTGTNTNEISAPITDKRVMAAQEQAANYIHRFIQKTYSGTLGAAGVIFLLWVTIGMLTRVEETFNDIWGVTRGRDWWSRITNYFTVLVLGPTLLVAALGLATGPYLEKGRTLLATLPFLIPLISQLMPVIVISLTFTLFYKTIPNTKVNFSAALVGGILAGTAWHVFNLISVHAATRALNTSKIYGSLALVPLLMVGLYAVWVMVLFGAQVAYAFQNRDAYLQDKLVENVNQRGREFIALRLMTCICHQFQRGTAPATVSQISAELGIPSRLVQQVLQTLLAARLVVEVSRDEPAYAPARPLENINAHHILMAMRATVGQELVTRDEPVREEVLGEFARIQDAERQVASAVNMLALVHRAQTRLQLSPPDPQDKEPRMVSALSRSPSPAREKKLPVPPSKTPETVATRVPEVEPPVTPKKPERASPGAAAQKSGADVAPETPIAKSSPDETETFPL